MIIRLLKQGKKYTWWMVLGLFLSFFTIAAGIGLMVTAAFLITLCAIAVPIGQLQIAITGVRFFGTVRGVFRYLERLTSHNVTFKLLKQYRVWFYEKIEPLAPAGLMSFSSGDLLRRLVSDVENLENLYIKLILPPLSLMLIILMMFVFLCFFNIHVAFIVAASLFISGYAVSYITYLITKFYSSEVTVLKSKITVMSLDIIQGNSDLVAFNQMDVFQKRFQKLNYKLFNFQKKISLINSFNLSLISLIMNFTVFGAIILFIPGMNGGSSNGITVSVVVLGIMASFEAVFPLPQAFQQMGSILMSARRVFEVIDSYPAAVDSTQILEAENEILLTHTKEIIPPYCISFDNVNFKYINKEKFGLSNISFAVKHNEKIAIVGPSGSGKSSIINLLMRFWGYDSGSIKIGDTGLKNFKQSDMAEYISVCDQKIYLFNDTIVNNLKLANASATEDDIFNALKIAEAYDFVNKLPKGLQTSAGEQGVKLSGGELRRIGIARALLSRAPILVFDEPNADLDFATGNNIIEKLTTIENRTVIIITHVFTEQFKNLDNIYVMNKGEVVEKGKHKELMGLKGSLYKNMFDIQSN